MSTERNSGPYFKSFEGSAKLYYQQPKNQENATQFRRARRLEFGN